VQTVCIEKVDTYTKDYSYENTTASVAVLV